MSTRDSPFGERGTTDRPVEGRFESIEMANGAVVIFDTRNPDAWIRSDAAVDGGARR